MADMRGYSSSAVSITGLPFDKAVDVVQRELIRQKNLAYRWGLPQDKYIDKTRARNQARRIASLLRSAKTGGGLSEYGARALGHHAGRLFAMREQARDEHDREFERHRRETSRTWLGGDVWVVGG